jgi:hypothetical protein
VFGCVAHGDNRDLRDVVFLIEMESDASAFVVEVFQYETQQLLGTHIDDVPTFTLPNVDDKAFVLSAQSEAVAL